MRPTHTASSARAPILILLIAAGLVAAAAYLHPVSVGVIAAAAAATAASVAFAVPLAVALARLTFEGRAMIFALLVIASATSPVLLDHAAATSALGRHIGLGVPIATWVVYLAARALPANLEAAAALDGRSALRIWAPLLAPSVMGAAALVFLYCVFDLR